jgi:hypothetical protein
MFIAEYFLRKGKERKKTIRNIAIASGVVLVLAAAIFFLQRYDLKDLFRIFVSYVWRPNGDGGIPFCNPFDIIPFGTVPFVFIGLFLLFRKKTYHFLFPFMLGVVFWAFFTQSLYFFIIDYGRVAVIVSLLAVIVSGFGFDWAIEKVKKIHPAFSGKIPEIIGLGVVLVIFALCSFSYTDKTAWRNLTLTVETPAGERSITANAPANHYLNEEDIALFSPFTKERFLSTAWKGLVVGATTGNYPLYSKPSIITNMIVDYADFRLKDCAGKETIATEAEIRLVYVNEPFHCERFHEIGSSREGFHLYEFR